MAARLKTRPSHHTNKYTVGQNLIPIVSELQTAQSPIYYRLLFYYSFLFQLVYWLHSFLRLILK